jgi:hypothetical protein
MESQSIGVKTVILNFMIYALLLISILLLGWYDEYMREGGEDLKAFCKFLGDMLF